MKLIRGYAAPLIAGLFVIAAPSSFPTNAFARPVSFQAADTVTVFANYEGSENGSRPLILLFHQAGSNRHEYDPIVPKLNAIGFDTLAIDQRSGGSLYGHSNETASKARGDFLAAYPDLVAALKWGETRGGASTSNKTILGWGSSYSASLVFLLAAKNPDKLSGILSFSPGEYFSSGNLVHEAASKVRIPVFVSCASSASEINAAKSILASVSAPGKIQFVPKNGTHGSSSLREDQNPSGAEENWKSVAGFLSQFK